MADILDDFITLKNVSKVTKIRRGIELEIDNELARFEFVKPDVMRVKISKAKTFDPTPSFAVICDEFGTFPFTLKETAKEIKISSSVLSCRIVRNPFSFHFFRADGSVIYSTDKERCYGHLNNAWFVSRVSDKKDAYYGFGEKTGSLNQNGRYLQMWNTDVMNPKIDEGIIRTDEKSSCGSEKMESTEFDPYYMSIPFFYRNVDGLVSGSFIDNCGHVAFDLKEDKTMLIRGTSGQYTEYVMAGPDFNSILRRYNDLTGNPFVPPVWSLGHHQCRWYAYDDKSIRALGAEYRKRKIPCDTLWLDIDYMDGYRVFTWNRNRYPDPKKTFAALKKQSFRIITIIDPGVKFEPGYKVYDEGCERDLFCKTESGQTYIGQVWPGLTAFPDFWKESARKWWGRLNAEHVKSGLAGIWNDMNEPATGRVDALGMRFNDGTVSHERGHNSYAMLMAMGTFDGIRSALPGKRTFILSRAGSAGIQRYAANWTGDNVSSWEHLKMSISMNCNLSISGQTFCGSDTGGFGWNSNEELLTRWYQYAVFEPFMRNHNVTGAVDQYPWSFGAKTEKRIRKSVELRYQLLPYVYTAMMQYPVSGQPLQRPLVFDNQGDAKCRNVATDYMFGPSLLVAPVFEKGAKTRKVYLPSGEWYDFNTGKSVVSKGGFVSVPVTMDAIPVFVKSGAVIPFAPVRQSTMEKVPDTVTMKVFVPAKDGVYDSVYYEDDGLTDAYLNGDFRRLTLHVSRKGKKLLVSFDVDGSRAPDAENLLFEFIGAKAKPVKVANRGSAIKAFSVSL